MKNDVFRRTALTLILATLPVAGAAQDDSLYPAPDDPNAAHLRLYAPDAPQVRIAGESASTGDVGLTDYLDVSPGTIALLAGDASADITVEANTHYTYFPTEDRLLTDERQDSPSQAGLTVYNLSQETAFDLYVPEADAVAIADVPPGESRTVALRAPLTLAFSLRQDGETIAKLDEVRLRRGTGTSVLILPGDDQVALRAEVVTDTYAD